MNTLTEDHLIYNIASYLRMPCMLQFATTNKRFHECIHGNDQLWNGGKDCKSWVWYPLNITSNDIFNAKPALERHAAHSKTPYRDLYLQLGKAEKEFLISYLSIFVPTAARSSSGGNGGGGRVSLQDNGGTPCHEAGHLDLTMHLALALARSVCWN